MSSIFTAAAAKLITMKTLKNPLLNPVITLLRSLNGPVTEYQLMQQLAVEFEQIGTSDSASLALFQKHFLLMNALYQWQEQLWHDGEILQISALHIEVHAVGNGSQNTLPGNGSTTLRDYYLNWQNLTSTTETDVAKLLTNFWQRYAAEDTQLAAYECLGLAPGADWAAVKTAYRRSAAAHHPDRGGDGQHFITLRKAYETLRCYLAP